MKDMGGSSDTILSLDALSLFSGPTVAIRFWIQCHCSVLDLLAVHCFVSEDSISTL